MCLCFNPCCNLDVVLVYDHCCNYSGYPYFPQCARVCLHPDLPILANICEVILFYIFTGHDVKEQGDELSYQALTKWMLN